MKSNIDYNTQKRQEATTEFKRSYHKLLNNACFGKTIESVRKRKRVVLVKTGIQQRLQCYKPTFKRFSIFNKDLVGVQLLQSKIILDKPIYVGFSVLESSKLTMYKFHYQVMKYRYPNIKLCFTDTDSFLYEINTNDLYEDLKDQEFSSNFDFSNYPPHHPLYSNTNKAVLGKYKDECEGIIIKEFIGLRSKLYSIDVKDSRKRKAAASGVKSYIVARDLPHKKFKETHETCTDIHITQNLIKSKNHELYSYRQSKIGLTAYDDKRYILPDNINTVPYGHYKLNIDVD